MGAELVESPGHLAGSYPTEALPSGRSYCPDSHQERAVSLGILGASWALLFLSKRGLSNAGQQLHSIVLTKLLLKKHCWAVRGFPLVFHIFQKLFCIMYTIMCKYIGLYYYYYLFIFII